ncbi:MAG: UPF0755 protein [Flavobacteriaceae bacterium]|jgi:UPF0755 protein|uniref:endolytic transglycosylase MltG n=1 Tax=Candidatus Marifrigoribacter sp. Uisw_064 TaxID=3230970 RepID=UPI003AE30BD1
MYIKKIVVSILLLGLIGMAAFSYYVYNAVFIPNTAFNNEEAHIYIPTNADFKEVLAELHPLLKDDISFEAVANRKKYPANIKPGHYVIKKGMNNNDIVNTIRTNNTPVKVKFNNQERIENLAGHLSRQIEIDSLAILNAMIAADFLAKNDLNKQNVLSLFIPNTYEVYWNITAKGFCDKMQKEYNRFWNDSRQQKASAIGMTAGEVISLAAIVQKETAKVDERKRVAGVYINRIKRSMLLQADPTVIYAKKLTENNFDQEIKRVLYKDLEIDSPYNTYKNIGLPPGPITMPDITSIDAVLNYENHNYFYFVANVVDFGYHKFAKTFAQHNRNRQEYVRWINNQGVNR